MYKYIYIYIFFLQTQGQGTLGRSQNDLNTTDDNGDPQSFSASSEPQNICVGI
jgi:hypothetical protein